MKRNLIQKLAATMSAIALSVSVFGTTSFAAELEKEYISDKSAANMQVKNEEKILVESGMISLSAIASYGPGDHDLGGFTFKDKNQGASRTYNAKQMQIKPAWKATDSSTSEVDLYVKVVRAWNGDVAYARRFTLNDDVDGKDRDGWWYTESSWFNINSGSDYYIYYEAFTTPGYSGTGTTRSAHVHTWIELRN